MAKKTQAQETSASKVRPLEVNKKATRPINIKEAEIADLLAWYNENSGSAPITKFRDRATAEKKCTELQAAIESLSGGSSKESKPVKEKKQKADGSTEPSAPRGRKSEHCGHLLYPLKDENPRREGSHGYKSYQILLDAKAKAKGGKGFKGLPYEEYIAAGGRGNDLQWDIAKEYVVSKPA